jgi:murein DD-endopeptidase MepM/ murein hydrolase activator NlpD
MGRSSSDRTPSPASAPGSPSSWEGELQLHPAWAGWRVRYLHITPRAATVTSILAGLYAAAVAVAIAFAPGVAGGFSGDEEHRSLASERSRQGERVQALVAQLDHLDRRSEELRLRLLKVALAYGLPVGPPAPEGKPAASPETIYALAIDRGEQVESELRNRLDSSERRLRQVAAYEAAHPDLVRSTPSLCPLRGNGFVLMSLFGTRRNPFTKDLEGHGGVDLAAAVGTPVYATADGDVTFAGTFPLGRSVPWWRLGNLVAIRNGGRFVTLFGHCDTLKVRVGQHIHVGDAIATVGNSGWSVSPHLHYEVRRLDVVGDPRPVDPLVYVLDHLWQEEERSLIRPRPAELRSFLPLPPEFEGRAPVPGRRSRTP